MTKKYNRFCCVPLVQESFYAFENTSYFCKSEYQVSSGGRNGGGYNGNRGFRGRPHQNKRPAAEIIDLDEKNYPGLIRHIHV